MAASWVDRPWLALDVESTGVDPFNDRIVEVAVVTVDPDGTARDGWSTVVNPGPGIEVPKEASDVNGITTERARAEGIPTAEALAIVARRIDAHINEQGYTDAALVAYNAVFDWPMLIHEAGRHDVDLSVFALMLDPYLLDRMCDKYRKGQRKLLLVASHYDVPFSEDEAHGALADATAAARVARKLLGKYPAIGKHPLPEVYARQMRGHETWRRDFVQYKRRTDPTFQVCAGWPVPVGPEKRERVSAGGPGTPGAGSVESSPSPAPAPLPSPSPPSPQSGGEDGEGVPAGQPPEPSDIPTPTLADIVDVSRDLPAASAPTTSELAKRAATIFKAAGELAPPRKKAATVDRVRHALSWAQFGVVSWNDLDLAQRHALGRSLSLFALKAYRWAIDYERGVTFECGDQSITVAWADFEQAGAA